MATAAKQIQGNKLGKHSSDVCINVRHASVAFAAAAFVAASSEAATCAAWSRTWSADCWAAAASFMRFAPFNLQIEKSSTPVQLNCNNQRDDLGKI